MIIELILNGLVQGSLFALICIGYSLAYGSAKVINFAHADVMIAGGGYLVLLWIGATHIPLIASIIMVLLFATSTFISVQVWLDGRQSKTEIKYYIATGVCVASGVLIFALIGRLSFLVAAFLAIPFTACLATAIYKVGYLPLIKRAAPRTSVLLAALGFSIAIESLLLVAWGSQRRVFTPEVLPSALVVHTPPKAAGFWEAATSFGIIQITSKIGLPLYDLIIVVIFLIVAILLALFFRYSRAADAIIASADSRLAAQACGIPVGRVLGIAFFIGGAVASLGGTLYILRAKSLDPTAGFSPGILAFAACVLGGIGSLRGSIAGAFLACLVISLAPAIPLQEWAVIVLPTDWLYWLPSLNLSDWSYGIVYVLMILIVLFKPEGLFTK